MIYVVNGKKEGFENTIYIGRCNVRYGLKGSPLANIFVIGCDGNRQMVIEKYREWLQLMYKMGDGRVMDEIIRIREIASSGKDVKLSCWCKPAGCHGDVIVEFLNRIP
ncbi:MAG: hypothetical protein BWK79_20180 [Beggiatoa sp. IS2]|nr:MAG: hypothetical protein BWK79_20180 [Beggiatoa sp. IS2]